ncbi:MAG: helix-turn-helix transcriptional regulator [Lentilitoribacter sp.]
MATKTTPNTKTPNPIDVHVGGRIKLRRNMLGISQEKLGDALGITFQQVQKYEKGANRVSASKLQMMAEILSVEIEFFFKDAPRNGQSSNADKSFDDLSEKFLSFMSSTQGVQLNRAFVQIEDPKVREKTVQFVKAIAESYKK